MERIPKRSIFQRFNVSVVRVARPSKISRGPENTAKRRFIYSFGTLNSLNSIWLVALRFRPLFGPRALKHSSKSRRGGRLMEETLADRSLLIKFLSRPPPYTCRCKAVVFTRACSEQTPRGQPGGYLYGSQRGWRNVTDASAALGVETSIRQLVRNSLELRVRMTDRATTAQKLFPRVIRADTSVTNYGNKPFVESTTRFPIDLRRRKALPRDLCRICRGCRETT